MTNANVIETITLMSCYNISLFSASFCPPLHECWFRLNLLITARTMGQSCRKTVKTLCSSVEPFLNFTIYLCSFNMFVRLQCILNSHACRDNEVWVFNNKRVTFLNTLYANRKSIEPF